MLVRHHLSDLLNELNSVFESSRPQIGDRDDSKVESSRWLPAVDIKEEPERFLLYVDLPGVDPVDVDIGMENNVLTVKGVREEVHQKDIGTYHRTERAKGRFYRRFTLPDTADAENISAKSKQGVIEIAIGKKKISQLRKIQVEQQS